MPKPSIAMEYVVPATASKVIWLALPKPELSSEAMRVSSFTLVPV